MRKVDAESAGLRSENKHIRHAFPTASKNKQIRNYLRTERNQLPQKIPDQSGQVLRSQRRRTSDNTYPVQEPDFDMVEDREKI
jgi:hypothetical protein